MSKMLHRLRTLVRVTYVALLFWSGSLRRAKRELLERGAIVVLTFHRVLDDAANHKSNSLPGIIVREGTFRKLVKYLVRNCEPVDLGEAVPGCASSKLRVAITFDDGWQDNYSATLPIAQSFSLPFTVFICPGLVGQDNPFWPERVSELLGSRGTSPAEIEEVTEGLKGQSATERDAYIDSLRKSARSNDQGSSVDQLLSWKQIRSMRDAGVRFGSHTQTHQILTTIPETLAATELCESKSAIETEFGEPCNVFAYPNGNCTSETRQWVADASYKRAVTTNKGAWTTECDPLSIPRLNVSEGNVTGLFGQFSPMMFEYTTFWWAWRALSKANEEASTVRDDFQAQDDLHHKSSQHPILVSEKSSL